VSSDRRIKTNIEDADTQICYNVIKTLKLKRFQYDVSYAETCKIKDRNMLGWIAQDVEPVFPKAVTITEYDAASGLSNFHGLDVDQVYKSMFGALHKVILDKEIIESDFQAAKGKIQQLEDTLSNVITRLSALEQPA
jgi:hypothetical protein